MLHVRGAPEALPRALGPPLLTACCRAIAGADAKRSGHALPVTFYQHALRRLRDQLTKLHSGAPPLFRVQTDEKDPARVAGLARELRSNSWGVPDVVMDDRNSSSLSLAFHRMVSADMLVLSRSSLSMAAALVREHDESVLYPACYRFVRRPLPKWTMLECKLVSPRLGL